MEIANDHRNRALLRLGISCGLIGLTLAVFAQTSRHGFITLDDDLCVTANPQVQGGLSLDGIRWALTTRHFFNWSPLTWLSHQLVCEFQGLNPAAHHLVNIAIHVATVLLLFQAIWRMTGEVWPSALVAALFALHPLHVESVAWVSERKGLLSTFFWVLTLVVYAGYVHRPARWRYVAIVACFVAGLASKQMLVTLPFALLLLDYWPLKRVAVAEKLPLIALSGMFSIVAYFAQSAGGALASSAACPLGWRLANAAISYVRYLRRMIWPSDLSISYAHWMHDPQARAWHLIVAVCVLSAITCAAVLVRHRRPFVFVGWFWYVGTLVPVIGLVQVGLHGMADRYSDIPSIGMYLAVVWTGRDLVQRRPALRLAGVVLAAAGLAGFAWMSWIQTSYWRTSETLFRHGVATDPSDFVSHDQLARLAIDKNELEEARAHLQIAIAIHPRFASARNNLALVLSRQGRLEEAVSQFEQAILLEPMNAEILNNFGALLAQQGRLSEAIPYFQRAIYFDPSHQGARSNLQRAISLVNEMRSKERHGTE